tara:strand:- start:375 stop:527 length:153 start_codon:yes stop_codon:yes gene_type:complete
LNFPFLALWLPGMAIEVYVAKLHLAGVECHTNAANWKLGLAMVSIDLPSF